MRLLLAALLAISTHAQTATSPPPTLVDRIVARVNDDIIQSLDVRRAKLLKLTGPDATTDDVVLERLIDRSLELGEVSRFPLIEPSQADIAARRDRFVASWPRGTNIPALLIDAGMSDANLQAWFRDTLRIEAHVNQRFGGGLISREEILAYFADHAAAYARPDGSPGDISDPAVQADIRAKLAAAKRDAAVKTWVEGLRARARIVR